MTIKKQLGIVGAVLLGLIIFSLLATIVTRAQEPGASATVVVDEAAREYRVRFSGLVDFGTGLPMRFRFDLSDRRCKDPARLTAGGTHIERLIYDRQAGEGGGTLERKEAIGPQCPFHVKHTVTVRLWSPSGDLLAHGSAPFCLGGCAEPTVAIASTETATATPRPTERAANTPIPTRIPIPPTKAAEAPPVPSVTATATATATLQETETATWTITPTEPALQDTPPGLITPRPTSSPAPTATATWTPTSKPPKRPTATVPTAIAVRETRRATNLRCLPKHAGRPVALCRSGSGSGWWLLFIGAGRVETGPHVPFPSAVLVGRTVFVRHSITGRLVALSWRGGYLQVRTAYGDGKRYVFRVRQDGRVVHQEW